MTANLPFPKAPPALALSCSVGSLDTPLLKNPPTVTRLNRHGENDDGNLIKKTKPMTLMEHAINLSSEPSFPVPPSQIDRVRLTIPKTTIPLSFKANLPPFLFDSRINIRSSTNYAVFFSPVRRLTSKGHMVDRLLVVDRAGVLTLYEDVRGGIVKRSINLKNGLFAVYEDGEYLVLHVKHEFDLCVALRRSAGPGMGGAGSTSSEDEELIEMTPELEASTAFWSDLLPRSFPKMMAVFSFFAADEATFYTVKNAPSFATKLKQIRDCASAPPTPEDSPEPTPEPTPIPTPQRSPTPIQLELPLEPPHEEEEEEYEEEEEESSEDEEEAIPTPRPPSPEPPLPPRLKERPEHEVTIFEHLAEQYDAAKRSQLNSLLIDASLSTKRNNPYVSTSIHRLSGGEHSRSAQTADLLPSANYFLQADKVDLKNAASTSSFPINHADLDCDEVCNAIDNDYADRVEKASSKQRITQVARESNGVDNVSGDPKVSIHIHHHHYDNKGLLVATSLGGPARRKQYTREDLWEVLDARKAVSVVDSSEGDEDEFDVGNLITNGNENDDDYILEKQRRNTQRQIQAASREAKARRNNNLAILVQCICSRQQQLDDLESGRNAEQQFSLLMSSSR